jgi:site-specific DNA recombinase
MKAVGYVRLTAEDRLAGYPDCRSQERELRRYAAAVGLDLINVYADEPIGVLASAPTLGEVCSRAGIISLLDDASAKSWCFVIVTEFDRLKRADIDFDAGEELAKNDCSILRVGDDVTIPEEPVKRDRRRTNSVQQVSVAERLLRGRQDGARAGKHQSGPAPYGYTRDYSERNTKGVRLQINPNEAGVVKTIFKEYLRRKSMKRLIEYLDSQGLKTRRDKQWSRAGVSWILKNETYLGRVHFGAIRAKGQHPPLVSPIVFNKVQKLIKKNNKRGGKPGELTRLSVQSVAPRPRLDIPVVRSCDLSPRRKSSSVHRSRPTAKQRSA